MTQRRKLFERLSRGEPESALADVRLLLEQRGWARARQKGSHATFTKIGEQPIIFPVSGGRWVKRPYVTLLLRRIGSEE
jgi:predicted RNA binding protein YcfA (HicA-like mRNA interferase family)